MSFFKIQILDCSWNDIKKLKEIGWRRYRRAKHYGHTRFNNKCVVFSVSVFDEFSCLGNKKKLV
jgi:hypothetical protein